MEYSDKVRSSLPLDGQMKYLPRPRKSSSRIHQYPAARLLSSPEVIASSSNDRGHAITSLVQSPAIDVVGVGFTSGEISVYDIRADERLMRMFMEGGGVRALGFRSGQ